MTLILYDWMISFLELNLDVFLSPVGLFPILLCYGIKKSSMKSLETVTIFYF